MVNDGYAPKRLHFYNLVKLQLYWGCATEDDNRSFDAFALQVYFCYFACKVGERPASDTYKVSNLSSMAAGFLPLRPVMAI